MIAIAFWVEAAMNAALVTLGFTVGIFMLLYALADWSVRNWNRNQQLTPEQLEDIARNREARR